MPALLTRLAAVVAPPFCWGCGADAGRTEPLCGPCRAGLRWLGQEVVRLEGVPLWSAVAYEGPARSLVRALKYRGAPGLADPLAAAIAACAPRGLLVPGTVLVPVPMPAARRRRRGFDQAERIAAALAARTGLELRPCLARGPAPRQVGRGRQQRLIETAGNVRMDGPPPPGRVVLVDDVATTGATLAACAAVLRGAGAGPLGAVTYARTPGR
ncbi:MAG TPA: hypothetical protein VEX39_11560 [Thermoleophilaceae bacterium]|nr:hypothetical protein [Thermoleophilaceae bacterium]